MRDNQWDPGDPPEVNLGGKKPFKKPSFNVELMLQMTIVTDWLEAHAHEYCKCENNGDYCEFHSMLADAKGALK